MFVIICIFVVFWPYIILLLNGRDTQAQLSLFGGFVLSIIIINSAY